MKIKIKIRSVADAEIQNAKGWYLSISPRLARHFTSALRDAPDTLRTFPEIGSSVSETSLGVIRFLRLKTFPYGIFYSVLEQKKEKSIIILGFRHNSQQDIEWEQRLN